MKAFRNLLLAFLLIIPNLYGGWFWNDPPLPVSVHTRKAVIAGGLVAVFTNTGDKTLSVTATFANRTFKEKKSFKLVLRPGDKQEIGGFEGWTVIPGETVTLSSDGYETVSYTFRD